MTICIAALCDGGKGCVLASDQMTTAHFPIGYEFETDEVEKIVSIAGSTYALIAGDVLFANQVIERTKQQFTKSGSKSIGEIAEITRQFYQETRRLHIVHTQLESRGLNVNSYYQTQQKLVLAIVQMIDQEFRGYNPRVDFIIAGKDSSGCHIYTVQNPGTIICNDPVGFAAIGTGGPHAIYALIEGDYKKSLPKEKVKELVQQAKTRSQVAPGVGKQTKIVVV